MPAEQARPVQLFLASYFKASYFGELFLYKLDDLK